MWIAKWRAMNLTDIELVQCKILATHEMVILKSVKFNRQGQTNFWGLGVATFYYDFIINFTSLSRRMNQVYKELNTFL